MEPARLEAFTDGVVAIIITIMVLEIRVPHGGDLAALQADVPVLLAYVLSYVNVGIFWNNHHHMLHVTERIDGKVLWANLGLLFWLSLVPFVIRWIDEAGFTALPTAAYGIVLACAAVSYIILQRQIIAVNGHDSRLAVALGSDSKGKLSLALYLAAIPLAFARPWIAIVLYVAVALSWLVPDKRIEALVNRGTREGTRNDEASR
jgi:TMEM175 potassium channel family protein